MIISQYDSIVKGYYLENAWFAQYPGHKPRRSVAEKSINKLKKNGYAE